ncbi:MAG: hypothetical protein AB1916_04940 [Thermodesulfobacteriota bacterium]
MDTVSVQMPGGNVHQFEGELVSRVVREEPLDERRSTVRTVSLYRVAGGGYVLVLDTRTVVRASSHYLHFANLDHVGEYLARDDGGLARELLAQAAEMEK